MKTKENWFVPVYLPTREWKLSCKRKNRIILFPCFSAHTYLTPIHQGGVQAENQTTRRQQGADKIFWIKLECENLEGEGILLLFGDYYLITYQWLTSQRARGYLGGPPLQFWAVRDSRGDLRGSKRGEFGGWWGLRWVVLIRQLLNCWPCSVRCLSLR